MASTLSMIYKYCREPYFNVMEKGVWDVELQPLLTYTDLISLLQLPPNSVDARDLQPLATWYLL
jgi:hypothetical protein